MTPERPHKPATHTATKTARTLKERVRNAAITGTAGGYLGGMLVEGKARVRIPDVTRKIFKIKRKTIGVHGARTGALIGALAGAANKGKRSDTVDSVATGGDWKFAAGRKVVRVMRIQGKRVQSPNQPLADERPHTKVMFSAYVEDMKLSGLPKEVQADVTRFVDAKKDTPLVHYGMTVKELLTKADPVNLQTARKHLGTLRVSRAADEVIAKTKDGSKYVLLMNDRVIDGHHFLAKAERGKVSSSLNVLDLTPARLITGKVTEFAGKPFAGYNAQRHARTGGLNDTFRKSYNREHGSHLKRPVTTAPSKLEPGSKASKRRASFCARMGGMKGATSKGGELTPKGAALKRWNCEVSQSVTQFEGPTRTQSAAIGAAVPVVAGGLILGTRGGRNALRGVLKGMDKKDPRRVRKAVLVQKRKDASIVRNSQKAVVKARDQFRAEAMPKAKKEATLGDAVKTVKKRVKQKIVKTVANIGANPHEVEMSTQFASDRTRTQKMRDQVGLAKDAAGLGVTAGVGVGAHKLYKQGRVMIRRVGPRIASTSKAWHEAALKAGGTLDVVKDAVSPVASTNRGLASVGRKIARVAKKATMWMHGDPRVALQFESPAPAKRERDKLSKARDAALIGGGVATVGAAGVLAHQGGKAIGGLAKRGRAMLRNLPVKKIGDNVRNSTRISSDVGRLYGSLTDDVRNPKRYAATVKKAYRGGVAAGLAGPVKPWASSAVKVGKKLRLLGAQHEEVVNFGSGSALVLSGVGTLIGSQVGGRMRYGVQNRVKRSLAPKIGKKWARRVGRVAGYAPENIGAIAGGVGGSILGGGIRRRAEMQAGGRVIFFGGREQLKDVDSSGFLDPLDVFVGRKKGYTAQQVKDYHRAKNYVHDVRSKRRAGSGTAVAAAEAQMKGIRDTPSTVGHGQVVRSLLKKGDSVRRVTERGGGLAKDAISHLRGDAREKDASGRVKKREWEKPWFQRTKNQVAAAAALGGGYALLKGRPKLRAKVDRGVRAVQRKVNSVVPDLFPGVKPLRAKGQKTVAKVQAQKQAAVQAKAAKTTAHVAQAATNIAAAAKQVKAGVPGVAAKGLKKLKNAGTGKPMKVLPAPTKPKKFASLDGPICFNDPFAAGWDVRDARGRSARVFAPGAGQRDRRPKAWHEKVENERKLWGAASVAGTLTGGLATRKLLQGQVKQQVKAGTAAVTQRAARWKAVAKAQHGRLQEQAGKRVKILKFNPGPRQAA